jgi:hypothetical protein
MHDAPRNEETFALAGIFFLKFIDLYALRRHIWQPM